MSDELLDKIFIAYNDLTSTVRKDIEVLRSLEIENKMKLESITINIERLEKQIGESQNPWKLIFVLVAMIAGVLGLKVMDKVP